jgi:hypothetical protein
MQSPGTKKPDDYQIIGLCIYAVLTDHRPGCWGVAIGGFVCALFVHLFILSCGVLLIASIVAIPLEQDTRTLTHPYLIGRHFCNKILRFYARYYQLHLFNQGD